MVAVTSAKATTGHGLWKWEGTNWCKYTGFPVTGALNSCISREGEPGFSTRSKMGPMSNTRKASSSPTAAISKTEDSNCHQYGATYRRRRVSCRIEGPHCAVREGPRVVEST